MEKTSEVLAYYMEWLVPIVDLWLARILASLPLAICSILGAIFGTILYKLNK